MIGKLLRKREFGNLKKPKGKVTISTISKFHQSANFDIGNWKVASSNSLLRFSLR
jgi:hypothetical protein